MLPTDSRARLGAKKYDLRLKKKKKKQNYNKNRLSYTQTRSSFRSELRVITTVHNYDGEYLVLIPRLIRILYGRRTYQYYTNFAVHTTTELKSGEFLC